MFQILGIDYSIQRECVAGRNLGILKEAKITVRYMESFK